MPDRPVVPSPNTDRVMGSRLFGCRHCGVFAYSLPVVHRPESNCAPRAYEVWSTTAEDDFSDEASFPQDEDWSDDA